MQSHIFYFEKTVFVLSERGIGFFRGIPGSLSEYKCMSRSSWRVAAQPQIISHTWITGFGAGGCTAFTFGASLSFVSGILTGVVTGGVGGVVGNAAADSG